MEIVTGTVVFGFGVLFFLWFLGALRTRLIENEGGAGSADDGRLRGWRRDWADDDGHLPAVGQGCFDNENMTDTAVEAVVQMGDSFFGGVELFAIPLLVGTGLVARRTGALPKWLAWFSFVLALVLAIIPIGWAGVLLGLPLWTLITAVVLFRTEPRRATAES